MIACMHTHMDPDTHGPRLINTHAHTHTHTCTHTCTHTHTHTLLYALALVAVDTVHDTDVDACDCTLRLYRHCKRVCTGS